MHRFATEAGPLSCGVSPGMQRLVKCCAWKVPCEGVLAAKPGLQYRQNIRRGSLQNLFGMHTTQRGMGACSWDVYHMALSRSKLAAGTMVTTKRATDTLLHNFLLATYRWACPETPHQYSTFSIHLSITYHSHIAILVQFHLGFMQHGSVMMSGRHRFRSSGFHTAGITHAAGEG
jgi:hypothetical protein